MALAPCDSPFLAYEASQPEADFYFEPDDFTRGVCLVSLETEEPEEAAEPSFAWGTVAPRLPEDFELGASVVRTPLLADAAGRALLRLFASLGDVRVEKVNVKKCSMKVRIDRGAFACTFKARLYDSDAGCVVEFQRRSGDALAFQELFYAAAAALDGTTCDDESTPSSSPPSLPVNDDMEHWQLETGNWVSAC